MKNFDELPVDCVNTILSLSSPRDVCRSAAACSELRLAAAADFVWERFLPNDYDDILSRATDPSLAKYGSKKELFFLLCNPLLIDGGRKIFVMDKNSGLKSYVLSARELSIAWSRDPLYWCWKHVPNSRFAEIVELRNTSWLDVHGNINTKFLSPNTTYGAYLIFNISRRAYGLDTKPMKTLVQVTNGPLCGNIVSFHQADGNKSSTKWLLSYNRTKMLTSTIDRGESDENVTVRPSSRSDGWMEIELGEFFSGVTCDDEKAVKMSLVEIEGHHLKAGLVIEGIEIRPL